MQCLLTVNQSACVSEDFCCMPSNLDIFDYYLEQVGDTPTL